MSNKIEKLEQLKQKVDSAVELLNLEEKKEQIRELGKKMQQEGFWNDQKEAKEISKKHSDLTEKVQIWESLQEEVSELHELYSESGEELEEEIQERTKELWEQYEDLEITLLLDEKFDKKNAIINIQSGSGGVEAQDWAEMLMRMIMRYSENKDWEVNLIEQTKGKEAGIKSATIQVKGDYAYGMLKSEDGTHRLVRISPFDSTGSRHTSFALIEAIPELEVDEGIDIDEGDLRIDTFMASKHGGQSVNTTDSAVRIVHEPTGITATCQNEKSQRRNKETAMKILRSRLEQRKKEKQQEKLEEVKGEYKSPEWGNQIRSYVLHPYNMVKDLRTEYESSDPEDVLDGNLDTFVENYLRWKKKQ